MIFALLACMPNEARYLARKAILTDDDGDGYSEHEGDCDDANPARAPNLEEVCDLVDNDCDDLVDEEPGNTAWYPDADQDGFGDESRANYDCVQPDAYIAVAGDCDDAQADVNPDEVDICNGIDDDCTGAADDTENAPGSSTYWPDTDGDGYPSRYDSEDWCVAPEGFLSGDIADDCDDGDANVNPAAEEVCDNGVDDNCDDIHPECAYDDRYDMDDAWWSRKWEGEANSEYGTILEVGLGVTATDSVDLLAGQFGGTYGLRIIPAGTASGADAGLLLTSDDAPAFGFGFGSMVSTFEGETELWITDWVRDDYAGALYRLQTPITSDRTLTASEAWIIGESGEYFGAKVRSSADISGDSVGDVLVGSPLFHDADRATFGAIYGYASSLAAPQLHEASFSIAGEQLEDYVGDAFWVDDYDGDGVDDVGIGLSARSTPDFRIFYGQFSGSLSIEDADTTLTAAVADYALFAVSTGDVTGDGLGDLVLGVSSDERAYVFDALPLGTRSMDDANRMWYEAPNGDDGFGSAVDILDIDNNGTNDVFVGARHATTGGYQAGAFFARGGPTYYNDEPIVVDNDGYIFIDPEFYGEAQWQSLGVDMVAGDFDADGDDDLAIGASGESDYAGAIYVLPGRGL